VTSQGCHGNGDANISNNNIVFKQHAGNPVYNAVYSILIINIEYTALYTGLPWI